MRVPDQEIFGAVDARLSKNVKNEKLKKNTRRQILQQSAKIAIVGTKAGTEPLASNSLRKIDQKI